MKLYLCLLHKVTQPHDSGYRRSSIGGPLTTVNDSTDQRWVIPLFREENRCKCLCCCTLISIHDPNMNGWAGGSTAMKPWA